MFALASTVTTPLAFGCTVRRVTVRVFENVKTGVYTLRVCAYGKVWKDTTKRPKKIHALALASKVSDHGRTVAGYRDFAN